MENLAQAFSASATRNVDKPAIVWGDSTLAYGHLESQAAWLADELIARGVQPGDRIGLWLKNCPEFVTSLFGSLAAGAVVVPMNNFLKPIEIRYAIADAGIRVIISEQGLDAGLAELVAAQPEVSVLRIEDFPTAPGSRPLQPVSRRRNDLAMLIYTSGTTGKPKGAMLTHGNLLHNVESCRQMLELRAHDRLVVLLPMFHSFMMTVGLLLPLLNDASVLIVKSLHPPKSMVAEVLSRAGTLLPAMAAVFRALSQLPSGVEFPSLRLCVSGAGPLPAEILKAFNARFPGTPLIEGYGLSEASPVVSVNPIRGPWIAGTIGRPIPDVELCVQDELGYPLPDGVDGELCVRGGNVMQGYWNAAEKTAEAFRNGWLLTGDIGHRRPDGFFVITDRKKDMLKANGINIYPREIEEAIHRFPGIRECAVIGEPDDRRGERPIAFISLDEGVSFDSRDLLAFLKNQLADYKIPRRVVALSALPRTATGKVLKTTLRELFLPAESTVEG